MKLEKGDAVQGVVVTEDHPTPIRLELSDDGKVHIDCGDGKTICLNAINQHIILNISSINAVKKAMEHCYRIGYEDGWNTAINIKIQ